VFGDPRDIPCMAEVIVSVVVVVVLVLVVVMLLSFDVSDWNG